MDARSFLHQCKHSVLTKLLVQLFLRWFGQRRNFVVVHPVGTDRAFSNMQISSPPCAMTEHLTNIILASVLNRCNIDTTAMSQHIKTPFKHSQHNC